MNDGRKFTSSSTLKRHQSDERLKDFLRVSKSHLINRRYIDESRSHLKDYYIYLSNGDEIKVSRRRWVGLKASLRIISITESKE